MRYAAAILLALVTPIAAQAQPCVPWGNIPDICTALGGDGGGGGGPAASTLPAELLEMPTADDFATIAAETWPDNDYRRLIFEMVSATTIEAFDDCGDEPCPPIGPEGAGNRLRDLCSWTRGYLGEGFWRTVTGHPEATATGEEFQAAAAMSCVNRLVRSTSRCQITERRSTRGTTGRVYDVRDPGGSHPASTVCQLAKDWNEDPRLEAMFAGRPRPGARAEALDATESENRGLKFQKLDAELREALEIAGDLDLDSASIVSIVAGILAESGE